MAPIRRFASFLINLPLLLTACANEGKAPAKAKPLPSIDSITAPLWQRLAEQRIYFGHQSVGYNIIDGLKDVMQAMPQIKLKLVELEQPAALKEPGFAHSKVGKNTDPASKNQAFAQYLRGGVGQSANFAFFKYCYVDIQQDTDPQRVFEAYKKEMAALAKEYPEVTLIHVTVPLRATQTGLKVVLKKLLGRPIFGIEENIVRNRYNELLRQEYGGKAPLFDLAAIESTYADGRRAYFAKDDKSYFSMAPEYTYDLGHLNEKGRKIVGEQLLIFLAELVTKQG